MLELDINNMNKVEFNTLIPPTKLSNDEYHKVEGISASGLKDAYDDPSIFKDRAKLKSLPSPALELGKALHEALLEPETFNVDNYKFTKANKEKFKIMLDNAKLRFSPILNKTLNEHSLFVQDNGFIRKIRMDAYDKEQGVIYDIKTTAETENHKFATEIFYRKYHLQASFYIDTLRLAGYKADYFAFLVVSSTSPCKQVYQGQLTDRFIEDGRASYGEALQGILDNQKNNGLYFAMFDLPRWRLDQLGELQ